MRDVLLLLLCWCYKMQLLCCSAVVAAAAHAVVAAAAHAVPLTELVGLRYNVMSCPLVRHRAP